MMGHEVIYVERAVKKSPQPIYPNIKYYRETTLGDIAVNSANGKGVTDYKRGMDLGLQLKYKF